MSKVEKENYKDYMPTIVRKINPLKEEAISIKEVQSLLRGRQEFIKPEEHEINLREFKIDIKKGYLILKSNQVDYKMHPLATKELVALFGLRGLMLADFARPETVAQALEEAIATHMWCNKTRIARTFRDSNSELWIRAIVTDRYGYIDDQQWFDQAKEMLDDNWGIADLKVHDDYTHCRFVNKKSTKELRVKENIMRAIDINNSEIGMGSARVQYLNYILECTNGMMSSKLQDFARSAHLGGERINKFNTSFQEMMRNASDGGWGAIEESFKRSSELIIPEPIELIERSTNVLQLRKTVIPAVIEEFQARPKNSSLYDVSMAYSKAAQRFNRDNYYSLEKAGGLIIDPSTLTKIVPSMKEEIKKVLVGV